MSPASTVTLIALLVGVLLFVVAALVWQESKRHRFDPGPIYVIEDAVAFIVDRLDADTRSRLKRADVRRIIEWEVYYLQGLAQKNRRNPVETVAGGAEPAVEYIYDEIRSKHNVSYSQEDIRRALRLEADYLVSIGAVGEPVNEETLGGEDR